MSTQPAASAAAKVAIPTFIVQAGGQGTRMEHYTWNKPKCLVPVDGLPLLYHLFARAPDAHFVVIGDYLFEVLKAYLKAFPPRARVSLVRGSGKGTCAGIGAALELVEGEGPVGVVWCDLLFEKLPEALPASKPLIGLSGNFPCRWSMDPQKGLREEMAFDSGVAGYFVFPNASFLRAVPESGEFVRWLSETFTEFDTVTLQSCLEVGNSAVALRQWERRGYARFFNDVRMLDATVEKRARIPDLAHKIADEADWYAEATARGYDHIPAMIGRDPLVLSRIMGAHPDALNLKPRDKHALMERIFAALRSLHDLGGAPADAGDCYDTYVSKTSQRVAKIMSLVPNADRDSFVINNKRCRNPFAGGDTLAETVGPIACDMFRFFHGDPTFANTLVTEDGGIFLIDPRVRFGKSKYFGDADYDWAKLYYSAIGDYDAFNRRRFRLVVWDGTVSLDIDSAGFSFTKPMFLERFGAARMRKVELLHALIWLSLAGWVDDDVDSMIAAFFNGLYWLEEWASA